MMYKANPTPTYEMKDGKIIEDKIFIFIIPWALPSDILFNST